MRNTSKLNKESEKAVNKCTSAVSSWANNPSSFFLHPTLCLDASTIQSGSMLFSKGKITVEPGETFRWNKAGAVSDYFISQYTKISFYKLNTRSKTKGSPNPGLKLWLFTIQTRNSFEPTYFLWCERGTVSEGPFFDIDLKLKDLCFLREFVSEELAKELNWI